MNNIELHCRRRHIYVSVSVDVVIFGTNFVSFSVKQQQNIH